MVRWKQPEWTSYLPHTLMCSLPHILLSPFHISLIPILQPCTDNGALENTGLCWIIQISSGSKPESKGDRQEERGIEREREQMWEIVGWKEVDAEWERDM